MITQLSVVLSHSADADQLANEEYTAAKREARRLGISLAELLRRSLRTMLPVDEERPWMRYAGSIESGDASASQNLDDVVYGRKD